MVKFNAKNLALFVLFGMLLFGITGIVNAQQTLPKGGDSFDTAVKLEPGNYKGGSIKSHEAKYFYTDVKPGQKIEIKGTFTPETNLSAIATIDLYDENRADLKVGCYESGEGTMDIPCEVSWMTNSDKESYKYYIKTDSDAWNITSYLLDISLINCYDAKSQTDAGDAFEKAISITSGEYKAYLSGKEGTDTKDFYKVAVKKGETLTVKVTPPSEATIRVVVYNSNRATLKDEYAPNPGAIVTNSVSITKSGDVFVAVICDRYCSENMVNYTLSVAIQIPAEGEVSKEGVLPGAEEGMPSGIEGGIPSGAKEVANAIGKGIAVGIIYWIIGPIVLLIIIGIVVYFLLKKKKTPKV